MHRIRTCPVYSTEQHGFEQQMALQQQAPSQQQLEKKDKTCIWVKYRQNKISALIDTGGDVSIAGKDVARRMGWTIQQHRIREVRVANNDAMSITGIARVNLKVGGCTVESAILILPDFEGLILGYDWLSQQGSLVWDVPNDLVESELEVG